MSNNSKAAVALLVGVAIGAGLGILFAPDEGSKTRKKLKEGFDEKKDELKRKFDELSSGLKSQLENPEQKLQSAFEEINKSSEAHSNEIIDSLERKLADLKSAAAKLKQ